MLVLTMLLTAATWLAMKHPEWLHEIWQQGPPVIVDDSEETFLKMNPHAQP
jgi:hypothetical protein